MTGQARIAAIVRRVMPAPPADVWQEWLDADAMAEWMCPRPARPTKIELDPRPGGLLRIDIDDEGFELSVTGRYLELDRPRLLSFTWNCTTWRPPVTSIVTVTFEPYGAGQTLMTIEHAQLPPDVLDSHRTGWGLIGAQLEAWMTSRASRPGQRG